MSTTRRRPNLPIYLLGILFICPIAVAASTEEIVTIEPGSKAQPIEALQAVDFSLEDRAISVRAVPGEPPSSFVSNGDYAQLPVSSASGPAQKNIELLNPDFDIATEALNEGAPWVAYNTTNGDYLVVYGRDVSATDRDIYGQRVSGAGVPTGPAFPIIAETSTDVEGRVVYNPTSNELALQE